MSSMMFLGGSGHSLSCLMCWLQYGGDEYWEHKLKRIQKERPFVHEYSEKVEEAARRCSVVSNPRCFQGLTL